MKKDHFGKPKGRRPAHASGMLEWVPTVLLQTGFLLVNLEFEKFGRFWESIQINTEIEAREQYSLIDTIFNYAFEFAPPGKYL